MNQDVLNFACRAGAAIAITLSGPRRSTVLSSLVSPGLNIIAPTASPIAEIFDRRRSARTTRQKTDRGNRGRFAQVLSSRLPVPKELMKYASSL